MTTPSPPAHVATSGPRTRPIYRVTGALLLPTTDRRHRPLAAAFDRRHIPDGGFGIAWLEAPLDVAVHIGDLPTVAAFIDTSRDGPARLNLDQGVTYGAWPIGAAWNDLRPTCPWNPRAVGIVADLPFVAGRGAVVFEDSAGSIPLVRWHCLICHAGDRGHINDGGRVRWTVGRLARSHLGGHVANTARAVAPGCVDCVRIAGLRSIPATV